MTTNRRDFIKLIAPLAAVAGSTRLFAGNGNKSLEQLRVGVVGFGGRGRSLINAVKVSESARLVALADVDQKILASYKDDDHSLFRTNDFRRILDRKDVDIIVSATPNHWHALLTVLSCQAGKHVYIEKPISHNMFESQAVVAAAERTGRFVQCGFQNRSDTGLISFYRRLHQGEFGKVRSVHGTCHRPRQLIGRLEKPLTIPGHIDYQLWLGPAIDLPIYRSRLHYDWHWDFNTGNGDVGNQGPHEWDLINWALGDSDELPSKIQVAGNRFGWNDAGNTPNVLACAGMLDNVPFYFEVMDLKPGCKAPFNKGVGVIISTDKGRFIGGRGGGRFVYDEGASEQFKRDKSQSNQDGTPAHMQNLFDAIVKDDRSMLRSDCRIAAKSSSMAHMANISFQLAQNGSETEVRSAFAGSPQQHDMIKRLLDSVPTYREKNQVDQQQPWMLGPELTFLNESGEFTGPRAEEANQKMKRDYRPEFSISELPG